MAADRQNGGKLEHWAQKQKMGFYATIRNRVHTAPNTYERSPMKVNIAYAKDHCRTACEIKIDKEDIWSGDLILAKVIYQFLKKFKRTKRHGWPMAFVK